MRISDWSSDVCSSDLGNPQRWLFGGGFAKKLLPDGGFVYGTVRETVGPSTEFPQTFCMVVRVNADGSTQRQAQLDGRFCRVVEIDEIGRASCRARVCQYV